MSEQCVVAARRYNEAYHQLHGRLPEVHINNGWIRINDMDKSLRPIDVLEMAARLERRSREDRPLNGESIRRQQERERRELMRRLRNDLREREESSSVWDVRNELNARVQAQIQNEVKQVVLDDNNESKVKITGWREFIRKDTMVMFFNKLFEKCNHSAFEMQRMMDHFIHFGRLSNEPDCDECEIHGEIENLQERVYQRERETKRTRILLDESTNKIKSLEKKILERDMKMKDLKKNSILFSMDDEVSF